MPDAFALVTLSRAYGASLASTRVSALAARPVGGASAGAVGSAAVPTVYGTSGLSGLRVASVDEPVLNKLVLNRYTVDLGYLLTDQEVNITAWNSDYSRAMTLTSVENSDPDAISVSGIQGLRLSPGAATSYTVHVRVVGKYRLDDRIRIVAAELGANSPEARLVGTRLVVFPLVPDWSEGLDESIAQASSVLTSYSGKEQRAQLMTEPRRTISYTVAPMDDAEAGFLEAFMWAWQARVFGVPEWQQASVLSATAGAGSNILGCDTGASNLAEGDYVLIHADSVRFEAARVAAVTSTQLTLSFPLTNSYAAGAHVVPVSFARIGGDVTTAHVSASASSAQLTFSIEP